MKLTFAALGLTLALSLTPVTFGQTAGQDMKNAGKDVKEAGKDTGAAAKNVGKATAKTAKTTGKTVKKTTHKAAGKVEEKTRDNQ